MFQQNVFFEVICGASDGTYASDGLALASLAASIVGKNPSFGTTMRTRSWKLILLRCRRELFLNWPSMSNRFSVNGDGNSVPQRSKMI